MYRPWGHHCSLLISEITHPKKKCERRNCVFVFFLLFACHEMHRHTRTHTSASKYEFCSMLVSSFFLINFYVKFLYAPLSEDAREREREEKKKITGSLLRVFACKVTIQMMSENRKIKWFNKHIESTNTHSDIHDMNVEWTWYSIIGCNQIFAYLISFRFVSFFRCEPLNALQLQTEWFRSQRWCTKFKFGVIVSVSVCVTQYVYPQLGCWW